MDPAFCPSCDEQLDKHHGEHMNYCYDIGTIEPCSDHCTLMKEMFNLKLCINYENKMDFCSFCNDVFDK